MACHTETNHPGDTVGDPDRETPDVVSAGDTTVNDGTAAYDTGTDNTGTGVDIDADRPRGYHHGGSAIFQLIAGRGTRPPPGAKGNDQGKEEP